MNGGSFKDGFVGAFFAAALNPHAKGNYAGALIKRSLIGGASAKLGGGKFANGAVSAAMAYILNDSQHALEDKVGQKRPSYSEMEENYPNGSAEDVFDAVGGKVAINGKIPADQGGWENSCTVRISVCMNASGAEIPFMKGETSSGANGKWHIYRVRALEGYLTDNWGAPNILSTNAADFSGHKGIMIFDTRGTWSNASGHATLWNGSGTVDGSNFFDKSSRVMLWTLPD